MKICGTTNLADAELALEAGADALGFIFAPSKRRIAVETAAEITIRLAGHLLLVGVFTRPDAEEIMHTVSRARLAAVQMHWAYDPAVIGALRDPLENAFALWQVVGFKIDPVDRDRAEQKFAGELRAALLDPRLEAILLDTVKGDASGGLGQPFSWQRAAAIVQPLLVEVEEMQRKRGLTVPRLIIAGGLNAENIEEAMACLQPWGVDVVSGVEASPGKKDSMRLREFLHAAGK